MAGLGYTSTQRKCEWVIPPYKHHIDYLPISKTFTSAKGKKIKLTEAIGSGETTQTQDIEQTQKCATTPSHEEMDAFFESLSGCNTKPAVLALIPKHSDRYISKSSLLQYPQQFESIFDPQCLRLKYHDLLKVCESLQITVSQSMAEAVEAQTQSQHKSKLWFKYRAGRVTTSRMKSVCHTNLANPPQSLIKTICYPEAFCITSKQTDWGCKHEQTARDLYMEKSLRHHPDLQIQGSGLVINPQWPFLGASPDAIMTCKCYGTGVLEIKCPYCHRETVSMSQLSE